jgi:hypothetical protein
LSDLAQIFARHGVVITEADRSVMLLRQQMLQNDIRWMASDESDCRMNPLAFP